MSPTPSDELDVWTEQLITAARKMDRLWKASDPLKPLGLNVDLLLAIGEVATAIHAIDRLGVAPEQVGEVPHE